MASRQNQAQLNELRRQAEHRLSQVIAQSIPNLKPENVTALVHELQVHQIELEMQCHELRRTQMELEESRDTYRELYEAIPVGYVTLDRNQRIYDVNPTGMKLLRWNPQTRSVQFFSAFFSDKDLNRFTLFCRGVVSKQTADTGEFEMKRLDGVSFCSSLQADPVKTGKGRGAWLRLTFWDMSQRKEAEETLRQQRIELEDNRAELQALTRRLFAAQEEERKRIARELHDDYCQRVTTLILDANMLRKACENEASHLAPRLTAMSHNLSAILSEFRALSHELLPRNLGERSLAGPIRDLVKEFNGKAGFEIEFIEQAVPAKIPPDTMTTIFRLLQESLSNITKHANATHVTVTLAGTGQGAELIVVDDGSGFDTARAWDGQKGMGIVGMRERVRLIGGTAKIISLPGQGTTIIFSIPLHELN